MHNNLSKGNGSVNISRMNAVNAGERFLESTYLMERDWSLGFSSYEEIRVLSLYYVLSILPKFERFC